MAKSTKYATLASSTSGGAVLSGRMIVSVSDQSARSRDGETTLNKVVSRTHDTACYTLVRQALTADRLVIGRCCLLEERCGGVGSFVALRGGGLTNRMSTTHAQTSLILPFWYNLLII
jgi:hypothetical protein